MFLAPVDPTWGMCTGAFYLEGARYYPTTRPQRVVVGPVYWTDTMDYRGYERTVTCAVPSGTTRPPVAFRRKGVPYIEVNFPLTLVQCYGNGRQGSYRWVVTSIDNGAIMDLGAATSVGDLPVDLQPAAKTAYGALRRAMKKPVSDKHYGPWWCEFTAPQIEPPSTDLRWAGIQIDDRRADAYARERRHAQEQRASAIGAALRQTRILEVEPPRESGGIEPRVFERELELDLDDE